MKRCCSIQARLRGTQRPQLVLIELSSVFLEGILLSVDSQKSAVYSYTKSTVNLPFENIFEEDQV